MKKRIEFVLNGERVEAEVEPNLTLLELLREEFELTGAKEGCGVGECGSCTVIVDGDAVNSCLMLAQRVNGKEVLTIEGLSRSVSPDFAPPAGSSLSDSTLRAPASQYPTPVGSASLNSASAGGAGDPSQMPDAQKNTRPDAQGDVRCLPSGLSVAMAGLHPIQRAFLEHGAVQCGFCTPGMIMSAKALLDENPNPTDEEIRKALAGNFCRCTGYVKILEAVRSCYCETT